MPTSMTKQTVVHIVMTGYELEHYYEKKERGNFKISPNLLLNSLSYKHLTEI